MGRHQLPSMPVLSQQVSREPCRPCGAVLRLPTSAERPFHDACSCGVFPTHLLPLRIRSKCASTSSPSILAIAVLSFGMQVHLKICVCLALWSAVAERWGCPAVASRSVVVLAAVTAKSADAAPAAKAATCGSVSSAATWAAGDTTAAMPIATGKALNIATLWSCRRRV